MTLSARTARYLQSLNDFDMQQYHAEGHAAYLASLSTDSHIENPYPEFTPAHQAWRSGWLECRAENK